WTIDERVVRPEEIVEQSVAAEAPRHDGPVGCEVADGILIRDAVAVDVAGKSAGDSGKIVPRPTVCGRGEADLREAVFVVKDGEPGGVDGQTPNHAVITVKIKNVEEVIVGC